MKKNPANFIPLSPLSFLHRTADVYGQHTSVIYENRAYTWSESRERCVRIASSLKSYGIKPGDTVSVLAFNTPEMFESHFSIPMAGAILNTINIRLDAATIAYIFDDSNAKMLFVDRELFAVASEALSMTSVSPKIVVINDSFAESQPDISSDITDYESLVVNGDPLYNWQMPDDEWSPLSLSYTSGTTGKPKGVVYHHRGAYLLAQGNAMIASIKKHSVYLWTLPMFHCNGWCFPWTMSAIIGTHVCLRHVRPEPIWEAISTHKVTHLCGAPIVMSTILSIDKEDRHLLENKVELMTAGAPPPASVLQGIEKLGFNVTQVYGLTETYGHTVMSTWNSDWDTLNDEQRSALKARQGAAMVQTAGMRIVDMESRQDVPADGKSIGEILIRGNTVMKGYLKDAENTEASLKNGWFHTGDLAVMHPQGYAEIKDRLKDIIISGGENISSVEIEGVLHKHEAVSLAAVVALPDEKWGEVPCAFIELLDGAAVTEKEIEVFCRAHMASFKLPRKFIFEDIPKTSTGKVQKFILRERARKINFESNSS